MITFFYFVCVAIVVVFAVFMPLGMAIEDLVDGWKERSFGKFVSGLGFLVTAVVIGGLVALTTYQDHFA